MSKNTKTVIILLVIAVLIAIVPLFALKNAEFGGSDDAGSQMIVYAGAGKRPGRRAAGRSGKSDFLCADRYRSGNRCLRPGPLCGEKEMDR